MQEIVKPGDFSKFIGIYTHVADLPKRCIRSIAVQNKQAAKEICPIEDGIIKAMVLSTWLAYIGSTVTVWNDVKHDNALITSSDNRPSLRSRPVYDGPLAGLLRALSVRYEIYDHMVDADVYLTMRR